MIKIREYDEEMDVEIKEGNRYNNRLVIKAYTEGGYRATIVDLLDVIKWVKENKPELLKND